MPDSATMLGYPYNTVLLAVALLWILPIAVAHEIGQRKNRRGWPWGLIGWIGVFLILVQPRSDPPGLRTFRPEFVTGAMEAGYTYATRHSDDVLLRQAIGSDQWSEVRNPAERADVLAAMSGE